MKREQPQAPGWLKTDAAQLAFERLCAAGVDREGLDNFLITIRLLTDSGIRQALGSRVQFRVPAKNELRQIRRLARKTESLASKIHYMNRQLMFRPEGWVEEQKSIFFRALPGQLVAYAAYLKKLTEIVGRFRRGSGRGKGVNVAIKSLLVTFVDWVRCFRTQPPWTDLADVLAEVLPEGMNASELRLLYERNPGLRLRSHRTPVHRFG